MINWAEPAAHVGQRYRQEYRPGVAEDVGRIVALRATVTVPNGTFRACVRAEDTTPLEPRVREYRCYYRGVGVVQEGESAPAGSELVAVERRSACRC